MFIGTPIDDQVANLVVAQLLHLESEDTDKDVSLYINCPGGVVYSGLAIYDTMQFIKPDVQTICFGVAMSMGSLLLAGGAAGKRLALPNSRILIHQPSGGFQGQSADIEIHAREILELRRHVDEIYSRHTGQPLERRARGHGARPLLHRGAGARVRADRPGDLLARAEARGDGLRLTQRGAGARELTGALRRPGWRWRRDRSRDRRAPRELAPRGRRRR